MGYTLHADMSCRDNLQILRFGRHVQKQVLLQAVHSGQLVAVDRHLTSPLEYEDEGEDAFSDESAAPKQRQEHQPVLMSFPPQSVCTGMPCVGVRCCVL